MCPSKGGATDVNGSRINLFPDVRDIVANIQECGIPIAAASRCVLLLSLQSAMIIYHMYSTTSPKASCELQKVLGIYDKFDFSEIYPRRKFSHFEKYQSSLSSILSVVLFTLLSLKTKSQVDYKDMIFFDDERWNISDIATLGNAIGIFDLIARLIPQASY